MRYILIKVLQQQLTIKTFGLPEIQNQLANPLRYRLEIKYQNITAKNECEIGFCVMKLGLAYAHFCIPRQAE